MQGLSKAEASEVEELVKSKHIICLTKTHTQNNTDVIFNNRMDII